MATAAWCSSSSSSWPLHNDLGPQDRFHWYSRTGWIMRSLEVGGLLAGATICIYDGSPALPDLDALC